MKISDTHCDQCDKIIGSVFGAVQSEEELKNPPMLRVQSDGIRIVVRGKTPDLDFCNDQCMEAYFEKMNASRKDAKTQSKTLAGFCIVAWCFVSILLCAGIYLFSLLCVRKNADGHA